MQLFKKMGCVGLRTPLPSRLTHRNRPRVILVEERGTLVGLVTLKDVLREVAAHELQAAQSEGDDFESLLEELAEYARARMNDLKRIAGFARVGSSIRLGGFRRPDG